MSQTTPQPTGQPSSVPSSDKSTGAPVRERIVLDDSGVSASYVNFCRVNGTPEELIIDVGLNAQPFGTPTGPLPVSQRLVLNYYTAKRLLGALQLSVQRHESAFGVLETDVQKRVIPSAARPSSGT